MATAMTQRSRSGRTIFAGHFVEGPGYHTRRPHGTDDWLIVLTLAGRGRFGYDGGENFVHERDLTLIRPGTMHDYGVEPELQHWEMLWCHFLPRPHWMDLLDWPEISPGTMNFHLSDPSIRQRITARFDDCVRLANGPLRRRDELAMNALEEVLLWADLENPRTQSSRIDPRIRDAMDFACRNLGEKLTLDVLADRCGLSVSRLSHLFREQVGVTPQHFIEQQRIDRAGQLLRLTQLSIKEIAGKVGFENPFYFTLRFKKQTGKSPSDYRRQVGGAAK
jgi:AraC family transcriptional regulator of arabinose operon